MNLDKKFWSSKKVLITGNTGFKGTWLTKILLELNARVIGYSDKEFNFSKYESDHSNKSFTQIYADVNNIIKLKNIVIKYRPQIIFHLAAQSLVYKSYTNPYETFSTNSIGTLNILEITKKYSFIKTSIIVTSDKCYKPILSKKYFDENSSLGGNDPYSASKAISEIMTLSYIKSFPKINVASVRAGNVIGGGDWSKKRLFPDLMRLVYDNKKLKIRNLSSVRPWQHVLEPLSGYLLLAEKLYNEKSKETSIYRGGFNFGPSAKNHKNVKMLIKMLENNLEKKIIFDLDDNKFHEEKAIFLNSNKSKKMLKWYTNFSLEDSISFTHSWYKNFYIKKKQIKNYTQLQIRKYFKLLDEHKKNKYK